MIQSILVPLDGSPFGEHALPLAIAVARQAKAKIHLLHVHTVLQTAYSEIQLFDATLDEQLRQRESGYLEEIAAKVRAKGIEVAWTNREGEIGPTILEESANHDIAAMTTHARGPVGRFWLGSLVDEVIRDIRKPLLLIHPADAAVDFDKAYSLHHILVPLDGNALAEQILDPVCTLAHAMKSKVALVRVLTPVMGSSIPPGGFGHLAMHLEDQVERIQNQLRQGASSYLESVSARMRLHGCEVGWTIELADQPDLGVLRQAQEKGADLIAVTTHGRRGLARLFVGSVANKILRGSTVPLLIMKPRA